LAQVLQPLNGMFPAQQYPKLLIGLDRPDDSAIYRMNDEQAIISTTDFFPPVVDDPYDFGAIAAANALSDVYAMGGDPMMAINLVAFPDGLDMSILTEIMRGGAEKVMEAGAVIAGGHTVADKEPKYGLSVTGQVHPDKIITKGGAQVGDRLILTKPLGTGVLTTALKNNKADDEHVKEAVKWMSLLNRQASLVARKIGVNAMTDITGYGLTGHGHEMAIASQANFHIFFDALDWLPGVIEYAKQDIFPGGKGRNQDYFGTWVDFEGEFEDFEHDLLYDPQTSGGLLISIASDKADDFVTMMSNEGGYAVIIGEVKSGDGRIIVTSQN